jgi:HK97 family phage prohead protease
MTEILELGSIEIRDDDEGDGRTISGLAVPWNRPTRRGATSEYPGAAESFAPGAFADAIAARGSKPFAYLSSHDGDIVGSIAFREAEDGLRYDGRLFRSQAATDYAERVAGGLDGVSLEFLPGTVRKARDAVIHTKAGALIALAGSHKPAYTDAMIAVRSEDEGDSTMTEETIAAAPAPDFRAIVREEITEARRSWAESGVTVADDPDAGLRGLTFGELMVAVRDDAELRNVFARALADQVPSESPGVMAPSVLQEVKGIVNPGRPGITAFGRLGLEGSGMSVDWPYFAGNLYALVGEQSAPKTEILSVDVPILKGTSPIKTYAGGSDVAYQLIRRSSPSYLDAYGRILLAAYAAVTDKAFVDQIEATVGFTPLVIDFATATADQIREAVFAGSVAVQNATGQPAAFVLASSTAFGKIGGKLNPEGAGNGQAGSATASALAPSIAGLPVIHDPNVNTGTVVISNSLVAAWHEDGPFEATDEDVAKLGRNVAFWGMGATAVYIPAGIVKTAAA